MSQLKYGKILQYLLNVCPMVCYQLTSAIEWEFVRWALANSGQRCVPNTNGPIIAQHWSSTGPTYVFTQCQRTNNYPTLPNVCRTSEQALVKMVSSSTIHKTISMSFASVANSLAKLIDVFIYNALKHFSCVFYLYIII